MSKAKFHRAIVPLSLLTAATGWSQDYLEHQVAPPVWRASLGYRAGINIRAGFQNVGSYAATANPGTTAPNSNHTYDDGYNLSDSSGNNHFGTPGSWNWGYQKADQSANADTIAMHSSSSAGASSGSDDDNFASGMELAFKCEIEHNQHWSWGLGAAFNYTGLSIKDSRNLAGRTTRLTDVYQLNGALPPAAPYDGSFGGPGTILGDTPSRSTELLAMPVTGSRNLDADLFGFRFGPYLEVPLTKRLSLMFDAGLALAVVDTQYSFDEYISTPDLGTFRAHGTHDNADVLLGGYVGANLVLGISEHWSAFGGVQWQDVGSYTNDPKVTGAGVATLDLRNTLFVTFGIGYSF